MPKEVVIERVFRNRKGTRIVLVLHVGSAYRVVEWVPGSMYPPAKVKEFSYSRFDTSRLAAEAYRDAVKAAESRAQEVR